jgi:hypothetical protein
VTGCPGPSSSRFRLGRFLAPRAASGCHPTILSLTTLPNE